MKWAGAEDDFDAPVRRGRDPKAKKGEPRRAEDKAEKSLVVYAESCLVFSPWESSWKGEGKGDGEVGRGREGFVAVLRRLTNSSRPLEERKKKRPPVDAVGTGARA